MATVIPFPTREAANRQACTQVPAAPVYFVDVAKRTGSQNVAIDAVIPESLLHAFLDLVAPLGDALRLRVDETFPTVA